MLKKKDDQEQEIIKIINRYIDEKDTYEVKQSKLINILHEIQNKFGFISQKNAAKVSDLLGIPLIHIYGVLTFYNFFKLKADAKYLINVCRGTACHINNSKELLDFLLEEEKNNKNISVEPVNCVGACAIAPVILINKKIYGHMSITKLKELIKKLN